MCKLYLLFISANAAQEKEKKREESAAAHWCFKVCSLCRIKGVKKDLQLKEVDAEINETEWQKFGQKNLSLLENVTSNTLHLT